MSNKTECKRCRELQERIDSLFEAIEHGNVEHRTWLKKKIKDHFDAIVCHKDVNHV